MNQTSKSGEPNAAADRLAALRTRLDALRDQLAHERRRTSRTTLFTAAAAVLMLILAAGYFAYGYKLFVEVTEPEKVVDVAEGLIDEKLPEARTALEDQIIKSAPQWADGLSKQAQSSLPDVRARLTDRFCDEAEKATAEAEILSEEHYRKFLRDNKPALERAIDDLSKSPELAEDALQRITLPLETQLAGDMKIDARELCKDIASVRKNLQHLSDGKGLTPEQKVERRVWMLARRLQVEGMNETPESSPAVRAVAVNPKGVSDSSKKDPAKSVPGAPPKAPADVKGPSK